MVKKYLNLVRVLFPRWNFFDQLGHRFHLNYKTSESQTWSRIEFTSEFNLLNFFCNSKHNLTLAQVSAIEIFAQEVQEKSEIEIAGLASFNVVKSIVENYSTDKNFKFQIEAYNSENKFELYVSPWFKGSNL